MEVPVRTFEAETEPIQADVIPTPGAKISTQGPKAVDDATWSVLSTAATV